ncbi:hypothetical protein D3C85_751990 [compost metagenome]
MKNVQLYKNGLPVAIGYTVYVIAYNARLNAVVYMNGTTDYLDARIYSKEPATISNGDTPEHNHFQAHLIGKQ